ncbi:DUF6221 family protein [Georgenia thermotolerans]|uniref:DUF6221 family protein n=1 Tax=Georgenia thermotolerans TaxID=527326 RepID=UPI0012650847|nr:DUF6221 family protein [Georgenia thermotolerans]
MTITEFLLARIAEDEAEARSKPTTYLYIHPDGYDMADMGPGYVLAANPARVLAECAAKRAIIEPARDATYYAKRVDRELLGGPRDAMADPYPGDVILRHLAAVYADHPDYQQEWKP